MKCDMKFSRTSRTHVAGEPCAADATIQFIIGGAPFYVCSYHAGRVARACGGVNNIVDVHATVIHDAGAGGGVKPNKSAVPEELEDAGFASKA